MKMFALLTLPRGVPIDPEAPAPPDESGAPVGIIIRPGPVAAATHLPARRLAAARA
jgi:hypothetical protein